MLKLENLKEGEKILMVLRRHWFVYVILLLYFLGAIFLSIVIYYLFGVNIVTNIINIIIGLLISLFLYLEWLNYELDLYVVTDSRIIGIEQSSFLNRKVSECNLGQIQEVNTQTKGLLPNILNYGTLKIQTAGNSTTMKMRYAPDTMQNARKILNIVDEYREKYQLNQNEV